MRFEPEKRRRAFACIHLDDIGIGAALCGLEYLPCEEVVAVLDAERVLQFQVHRVEGSAREDRVASEKSIFLKKYDGGTRLGRRKRRGQSPDPSAHHDDVVHLDILRNGGECRNRRSRRQERQRQKIPA